MIPARPESLAGIRLFKRLCHSLKDDGMVTPLVYSIVCLNPG
jgi:anaerobic glycerol-3-phosphate dehydrogenase